MKILLTTTSFQDTPGEHHDLLKKTGWEIITARGPLNEADTLALVGEVDGYICGDDAITRKVLEKARPKLKVLSKYGIGVDKIDVKSCTEFGIPLLFTPGVNHTTVAEHNFLLLLALEKNFLFHTDSTRAGGWKRKTGHELLDKTIGIIGLGRIGKEVAIRARAFGMNVIAKDNHFDEAFRPAIQREKSKLARRDFCRFRLRFAAHKSHAGNARLDLRQVHRQDEKRRFDFELRARRDCEHERHGGRAEIRAGGRLRHGRFGSRAAGGGSSAAQAAERRLHAARRVAHLRERGAAGHLRREKSHPRDERRKTHRAGES